MIRREAIEEPAMAGLAESLGAVLEGGETILMLGSMGSGKTTFTRALAKGLRVQRPEGVCSPTYTVCMVHEGPVPLVHVDLFRLGESIEGGVVGGAFESLGLSFDALSTPDRVVVVEWAELWSERPTPRLEIEFHRPPGRLDVRDVQLRAVGNGWADARLRRLGEAS